MPYYTVNRDDNDLRIIICPKCRKPDITKYDDYIPYTYNNNLLKLMKCNSCKTYFTFYREDGLFEITKEIAETGIKNGYIDLQNNGMDEHGHCYYVAFKNKPPIIKQEDYYKLKGWDQINSEKIIDTEEMKNFEKWLKILPSLNQLVKCNDLATNIDMNAVQYFD